MTSTIRSADGTLIAYEASGEGPAVVLVDGALCHRASGPARKLAAALAPRFTVYAYDRRGRGESADTPPHAVEREVEDLEALIAAAGGSAAVYGISSGAVLALEAAQRLPQITRLALYEAPFIVDDTYPPLPADYVATMHAHLAAGDGGAAVRQFMRRVGVPAPFVALMRMLPVWRKLTAVAHTLPYDFAAVGDAQSGRPLPAERWDAVRVPALAIAGGKSPAYMKAGMREVASVLADARYVELAGQNHMVKPSALAPVLREFLAAPGRALNAR